jgi:hypothetical protein
MGLQMLKCNIFKEIRIIIKYSVIAGMFYGCIEKNNIVVTFLKDKTDKAAANVEIICPTGYVAIPANGSLNVEEFCIMKYEARPGKMIMETLK